MIITAHGGALGTGRNTKAYFNNIDKYGADALEVDIYKSGDLLYLSHWPSFFPKRKLTLRYAFEHVKKTGMLINCDLKMKGIIQDVIALAKEVGVQDQLIFTGCVNINDSDIIDCGQAWFNSVGIEYTKNNVKAIKEKIDSYNNPHFAGLNVNFKKIDLDFVAECKKYQLKLSVFRIDGGKALAMYGKIIDGNITTNQPVKVRRYVEG
ncbi:MAG: hypothetical protein K2L52_04770 [Clostridia bacterium]|nr:hypothetical protein [Clostridia bacterium]